jgi:DNA-binding LacI/PurR family transcriptional regulator
VALITRAPLIRDQVVGLLREEIAERRSIGEMLPGETALATQLKVSRNTVRAAYAALEREGLIERKHGKGTIIVATAPRSSTTGRIGLVFFAGGELMFTVPFYGRLIQRLYALGRGVGWHIALMTHDRRQTAHRYDWREHEYRLGDFQAMLLLGVFRPGAVEALGQRMPVVAVDAGGGFGSADSVVTDNFRAGMTATEHLVSLGHTRIAYLGAVSTAADIVPDPAHVDRYRGYRAAMQQAGIDVGDDLLLDTQSIAQGAGHAIRGAIERGEAPTAVVTTGDRTAATAMEVASRAGLRIPDMLSVLGMGNEQPGGVAVPLTTVELNPERMADEAVRLLRGRIENPSAPPEHCVVDVDLIERDSTVPPSSGE